MMLSVAYVNFTPFGSILCIACLVKVFSTQLVHGVLYPYAHLGLI